MYGSQNRPITLFSSAARAGVTTGTYGTAVDLCLAQKPIQALCFCFDLTASGTDNGDHLDVYVQTSLDLGVSWTDVVHFTQIVGDVGAVKTYYAKVTAAGAETMYEIGSALSAAGVRNIIGNQIRGKYVVVDAGTANATFTFSLTANVL